MTSFLHSVGKLFRSGRCWLAIVLLLGIAGCQNWNLRGDKFSDDELSSSARKARPEKKEKDIEYWSYSEKARQVERDLQGQ